MERNLFYEHLQEESERPYSGDLEKFAEWVAEQVCKDDFDDDGCFAEMACRKLWRLGIVEMDGDEWVYRREK